MREMLNRLEAAESVGVSETAFDASVRPYVPVYRIGRRVMWRRSDLETFLDARALTPPHWAETVKLAGAK